MNTKFDLTTKSGLIEAANAIKNNNFLLSMIPVIGPIAVLGKMVMSASDALSTPTQSTLSQQKEAAIDIIKAGWDAGGRLRRVHNVTGGWTGPRMQH